MQAFNETWLESRYGWSQLVYTTEDIRSAAKHINHGQSTIATGSASQTVDGEGVVSSSYIHRVSGSDLPTWIQKEVTVTKTARANVAVKVKVSSQRAIDLNPLSAAWEVVPYSFVVDWFLTTGDFFRAAWPRFQGVDHVACTSVKTVWQFEGRFEGKYANSGCGNSGYHPITPGAMVATKESYSRSPYVGEIPLSVTWNPRFGWKQMVDAIALLPSAKAVGSLVKRFAR
jgi:hypothetical protein